MQRIALTMVTLALLITLGTHSPADAANSASLPSTSPSCDGCLTTVPLEVDSDGALLFAADLRIEFDPTIIRPTNVVPAAIADDCAVDWAVKRGRSNELAVTMTCPSGRVAAGPMAYALFEGVAERGSSSLRWHTATINNTPVDVTLDGSLSLLDESSIRAGREAAISKAAPVATAEVSIPKSYVCEGPVEVPISVCPSDGVIGMDFRLAYDPALVTPVDVVLVDLAVPDCFVNWTLPVDGEIAIAISCTSPLADCGDVAIIEFDTIGAGPATSDLIWLQHDLNEGQIDSTAVDGEICITSPDEFLALPGDAKGLPGGTVFVPLTGDLAAGSIGINAILTWDPAVLTALSITVDGSLPGDWSIDVDLSTPGTALISLFGTTPISGALSLANIEFSVIGAPGETTDLIISFGAVNEIPVCLDDGAFSVNTPPQCGNGILEGSEECDDGNNIDGDGCSADCVLEGACCTSAFECFLTTQFDCETNHILYLGDGTDCSNPLECDPLEVTLDSISVTATPAGVLVQWVTATEIDTIGFRVLRETLAGREKRISSVTDMIVAVGTELSGASYEVLDDSPAAARAIHYYLEDIDVFGRTTRHGPFAIDRGVRQLPTQRSRPTR